MQPTVDVSPRPNGVSWRSVALPTEHGGWGFTLEPIILGLLVVPSAAAWEISVTALAIFLARRPAKLALSDIVRRRWLVRSTKALVALAGYAALAVAGAAGALVTARAPFWQPLALAVPLAGFALLADARTRGRTLAAELAGSIAMGATATAIALAGGWSSLTAFGLWFVLVSRDVATIALVRGQIRRVHDKPVGATAIYGVQVLVVVAMSVAAAVSAVPWLAVVALVVVGGIAYRSLTMPPLPARKVGWTQIAVGLGVVFLTAIGVWIGW